MILVNIFLTHHFYYQLLKYQAGSVVGKYLRELKIDREQFQSADINDPLSALDFYAGDTMRRMNHIQAAAKSGEYILTSDSGLVKLAMLNKPYTLLKRGRYFKVSELTPEFLNYRTRDKATTPYYVLRVQ